MGFVLSNKFVCELCINSLQVTRFFKVDREYSTVTIPTSLSACKNQVKSKLLQKLLTYRKPKPLSRHTYASKIYYNGQSFELLHEKVIEIVAHVHCSKHASR